MEFVAITDTHKVFVIGSALTHMHLVVAADAVLEEVLPVQAQVLVLRDREVFEVGQFEGLLGHSQQQLLLV